MSTGHLVAVRTLREVAGMTCDDVATAAGISAVYLREAEGGRVRPTAGWWQMVAAAIGGRLQSR